MYKRNQKIKTHYITKTQSSNTMKTLMKNSIAILIFFFIGYTAYSQTDTTTRSSTSQDFDRNAAIDIERQDELDRSREGDDALRIERNDEDNRSRDADNTRITKDNKSYDTQFGTENQNDDSRELRAELQETIEKINDVEVTGNQDADFARIMIEHHKGAVDLSDAYINKTQNEQMKKLVTESRDKKKADIKIMEDLLDKLDVDKNSNDAASRRVDSPMKNTVVSSMSSPDASTSMRGDIDSEFAKLMIDHHKQAIELSRMEVESGSDIEMKAIAKKIIDDNEKQISQLKSHKSKDMNSIDKNKKEYKSDTPSDNNNY
jgi:uncharacterized protein (DUF305 family)